MCKYCNANIESADKSNIYSTPPPRPVLQRVCVGQTDDAQLPNTKKGYVNADIYVSSIIQNKFMDIVRF